MKRSINTWSTILVLAIVSTFASCKKDSVTTPVADAHKLLMARTWQVEEVSEYMSGVADIQYKRGAPNNQDDFSLVRQRFNKDGSITYTDEFGLVGNDGTWQLQDNNTAIRIGWPTMGLFIVGQECTITDHSFSYKIKSGAADEYTQFIFSPAQ